MARTCKKCFLPLKDGETECANCGAYNQAETPVIPIPMKPPAAAGQSGKKKFPVGLVTVIALLLILVAVICVTQCSGEPEEEVEYTPHVWTGRLAYIHVKSVSPEYGVSSNYGGSYHSVVCKCTTTAGDTVWLYISISDYNKHIDEDADFNGYFGASFKTAYLPSGSVIHGKVRNTDDLVDGDLAGQIGTDSILKFESFEKK